MAIAVEAAGEIVDMDRLRPADSGYALQPGLIAGIIEFHVADKGDEAAPLRLLDQRARLLRREGKRLLDDQVLAGADCIGDHLAMIVGADHDRIDIRVGKQRAMVGISGSDAIMFRDLVDRAGRDVAQGGDAKRR